MLRKDQFPVRIEHGQPERANIVVIDWTMGNTCDYACSYCPARLHDASSKWHPADAVISFCIRLRERLLSDGKSLHIQFTGGEVTLRPQVLDLFTSLRRAGCTIGVISNASRSLSWWRRAVPLLHSAVLTFHAEYAELDHFISVANLLSEEVETHINVTAAPLLFDKSLAAAERISECCRNVSVLLKPMFVDFKNDLYPYSEEQLRVLTERRFHSVNTRLFKRPRGEMRVKYGNGEEEVIKPSDFILRDANHWSGWSCHVGLELLAIDLEGNVYRGLCREGGTLGNILQPDKVTLPIESVVCTKQSCRCLLDIMTTRYLPEGA